MRLTYRFSCPAFYMKPLPAELAGEPASGTNGREDIAADIIAASLRRMRIVLVAPSHAGNVGAAARAMKVMGLTRLALVAPRFADVLTQADALAFASGAADLLKRATVHATLADALAGVSWSVALTAREREFAPPLLSLGDAAVKAAALVAEPAQNEIAFVFGSERYGLSNDDVLRCQAMCAIETGASYTSLNLAQAVQLVAYECCRAALARATSLDGQPASAPQSDRATHEERESLVAHFEAALVAIGYLDPAAPKKLMPRLRRLFARAELEHEEVQWLRGIAKAMLKSKR